jgi:hypothetical protein
MNALSRATVHGLLNFIRVGTALINNYGIALFFVQFEYFRADFLTGTAGDALGVNDVGNPHFAHWFLLGYTWSLGKGIGFKGITMP